MVGFLLVRFREAVVVDCDVGIICMLLRVYWQVIYDAQVGVVIYGVLFMVNVVGLLW